MRSARVAFTAITASVGLFAVLETAAMRAYPGGTWWEPTRAGASFWENYLCDFVRASAIDGAPNAAGSRLAAGAMVALTLGLVPVWLAVPRLWGAPDAPPRPAGDGSGSPAKRSARTVRVLGVVSVIGILAVIFLPSDRYSQVHGVAVVLAGLPGLSAAVLTVVRLLAAEPRPRAVGWLGAALLASAGFDFAAYVGHLLAGGAGTPMLPILQRVALMALLAWMLAVAWELAQADRRHGQEGAAGERSSRPHSRP